MCLELKFYFYNRRIFIASKRRIGDPGHWRIVGRIILRQTITDVVYFLVFHLVRNFIIMKAFPNQPHNCPMTCGRLSKGSAYPEDRYISVVAKKNRRAMVVSPFVRRYSPLLCTEDYI